MLESARREATEFQQRTSSIHKQYEELESDIGRYKQLNQHIEKLQKQMKEVQDKVIDLGSHTVRARTFETTGTEPGSIAFQRIGCSPSSALQGGQPVAYCAQGSPPTLFQITAGAIRPVASSSPIGYQDVSAGSKPSCTTSTRGTFFVEKGGANVVDKPYLCVKNSDNTYSWNQLGAAK